MTIAMIMLFMSEVPLKDNIWGEGHVKSEMSLRTWHERLKFVLLRTIL